ncbi:Cu(I)-responsive transcriptional regulator [Testudinibacter sp. TR-2022]|uniref:Cu(I)-responsive transcriptional regulator n=1 Tax=Testudinibacter sp. TR-2022 TaxID=2585029 RepID=UPI00111A5364|nr:Cu(I)-responsive transcriptional regulator [Testudinibacter sp. TR-2022]TNH08275.1 Cu(I)-responsive transcriptional regulator [Pasteurellaceae bacterium Phil11]TNH21847.1 Cu(I)-responsive transcriptional regulator [Testudinibacter sp. TR-2022]TNH24198.1 Cu(I)-responsive transcriptional regulator [Testudinibacter sp. TR-2022]
MNIKQVAALTGLSDKTIRFYEEKGIITPPRRSSNGYRQYDLQHVDQLRFVQRTRSAGFSLPESKELLELYLNPQRHSREIKQRTLDKIQHLERQITQLQEMKRQLTALADECPGDDQSQCPIIDSLSGKGCCHK